MPIYTINQWFGGMSNSKYAGGQAQLDDVIDLNINNGKFICLGPYHGGGSMSFYNDGKTLQYDYIIASMYGNSSVNKLTFSKYGDIVGGQGSFVNLRNILDSVNSVIYNAGKVISQRKLLGFIFIGNSIYKRNFDPNRYDLGLNSGDSLSKWIELPSDVSFSKKGPYIIRQEAMYIGCGDKVKIFNILTGIWEPEELTIDGGYEVTYISQIGDIINVYAHNGTHGKQYFWTDNIEYVQRVIDWYDKPILGGATLNNIDYVITGTNFKRELYMINGYQAQKLFASDIYTKDIVGDKFYFELGDYPNVIETIGDNLVIPGKGQIYIFGNDIGYPQSMKRYFFEGSITHIAYQDSIWSTLDVYTKKDNDTMNGSGLSLGHNYHFHGTAKSLVFDGGNYSQLKQSEKMRIGYDLPYSESDGLGINIYQKIDDNDDGYANFVIKHNANDSYIEVGDIYINNGVEFEVYDITKFYNKDKTNLYESMYIIHTKTNKPLNSNFKRLINLYLSKSSGNGPDLITSYMADYGFQLIKKIDNLEEEEKKGETTFVVSDVTENVEFHSIQIKFDLRSSTSKYTPKLYNFDLSYDIIKNDLQ